MFYGKSYGRRIPIGDKIFSEYAFGGPGGEIIPILVIDWQFNSEKVY